MQRVSLGAARGWGHWRDVLLLALTWAAGYVDAIGYLALGGVFTANMTGNTVLLGLHVSQEQGAAVLRSLVALGGFGAGLLIGALIVERGRGAGPWPSAVNRALALEAVFLGIFAIGWHLTGAVRAVAELQGLIALLAAAMGIQSAAVRRLDVPGIATTYMTGTLTSAVTGLVARTRVPEAPAAAKAHASLASAMGPGREASAPLPRRLRDRRDGRRARTIARTSAGRDPAPRRRPLRGRCRAPAIGRSVGVTNTRRRSAVDELCRGAARDRLRCAQRLTSRRSMWGGHRRQGHSLSCLSCGQLAPRSTAHERSENGTPPAHRHDP